MNKCLIPILAAGLLLSQIRASQAVAVTFAQLNAPSNSTFTLTPAGAGLSAGGNTGVYASSSLTGTDTSAATFFFSNTSGVIPTLQATPFGAQNPIAVNFSLTAFTNQDADGSGLNNATQTFNTQTFSITARGNQVVNGIAIANGANLLTETITTGVALQAGTLAGTIGGSNATFNASDVTTGNPAFFSTVTFTSAYINFAGASLKGSGFGFSSVTPFYNLLSDSVGNQYIGGFTAAGVGTFNAQFAVPEPGSVALLVGMGVSGSAFFLRRRRK